VEVQGGQTWAPRATVAGRRTSLAKQAGRRGERRIRLGQ